MRTCEGDDRILEVLECRIGILPEGAAREHAAAHGVWCDERRNGKKKCHMARSAASAPSRRRPERPACCRSGSYSRLTSADAGMVAGVSMAVVLIGCSATVTAARRA